MLAGIYASQMMKKSAVPSLRDTVVATFAGSGGAFYDLTDISTLWKDAARTVPATMVGDVVKGITDLSGNGAHLSTVAVGTVATLVSDVASPTGVAVDFTSGYTGDGFISHTINFGTSAGLTACSSYKQTSSPASGMSTIGAYHAEKQRLQVIAINASGGNHFTYFKNQTADNTFRTLDTPTDYGINIQAMETRIASATDARIRHNGVDAVSVSGAYAFSGGNSGVPLTLGVDHGATYSAIYNKMVGRIYSAYFIDRNLSGGELAVVESYIASRGGVSV